jgi:hypothetical protein
MTMADPTLLLQGGSAVEEQNISAPFVVPFADIPLSQTSVNDGFKVRRFLDHHLLSAIVPSSTVALAIVQSRGGRGLTIPPSAAGGLLVVLQGQAQMASDGRRAVKQGDVIILSAGAEYLFTGVGAEGLQALHLTFGGRSGDGLAPVLTREGLLARNEERARAMLQTPYFQLLQNGTLSSPDKRRQFRTCIRVFSDAFQRLLFTRQAMCRDEKFDSTFHEHLREELGHNRLLRGPDDSPPLPDPVLHATSTWFCQRMLLLDNLDKAVVNIVLETAGYHFHTLAQPAFAADDCAGYFSTHAEADAEHQGVGLDLLQGAHPTTYLRLHRVLEETWDMLGAMTNRIATLLNGVTS